jgi:uncharacterized protein (UPF0333 family)
MRKLNVVLATLLLVVFAGTATAPVKAVQGNQQDNATTTYVVGTPGEPISVTVEGTYTNLTRPTTTYSTCTGYTYSYYWGWQSYTYSCTRTTTYYSEIYVHIEAASTITSAKVNGKTVTTHVMRRYTVGGIQYQALRLGTTKLYYNDSASYTLTYKVLGGAPRSSEATRVGAAYTYFCPSGTGKDGGSITVRFPAGYTEINALGNDYTRTENGGGSTFTSGQVNNAFKFFSCIEAINPSLYKSDSFTSAMGTTIELRGWPGDYTWMAEAKSNLSKIVNELETFTGVPLAKGSAITVREASNSGELGGYAGRYAEHIARVSENFDDLTAAHELAHVWFNSDNLKDNWAFEGITEFVAQRALKSAGGNIGTKPCSETYAYNYTKASDPASQPKLLEWEFFTPSDSAQADDALKSRIAKRYDQACAAFADYLFNNSDAKQKRALQAIISGISPVSAKAGQVLTTHDVLDILAMTTQDLGGADLGLKASNDWGFAPLTTADQTHLTDREAALKVYEPIWTAFVKAGWTIPQALSEPIATWNFSTLKSAATAMQSSYLATSVAPLGNAPILIQENLSAAGYVSGTVLAEAFATATDPSLIGVEIGNLLVASASIKAGHELLLAGVDPITAIGGIVLNPQGGFDSAAAAALAGDGAMALGAAQAATAAIGNRTLVGALVLLLVFGALLLIRRRRMQLASVGGGKGFGGFSVQVLTIRKRVQKLFKGGKKRPTRVTRTSK